MRWEIKQPLGGVFTQYCLYKKLLELDN